MLPLRPGLRSGDPLLEQRELDVVEISQATTLVDLLADYELAVVAAFNHLVGSQLPVWELAARDTGVEPPVLLRLPLPVAASTKLLGLSGHQDREVLLLPKAQHRSYMQALMSIAVLDPVTGAYRRGVRQRVPVTDVLQLTRRPAAEASQIGKFMIDALGVLCGHTAFVYEPVFERGFTYPRLRHQQAPDEPQLGLMIAAMLAGESDPYGVLPFELQVPNVRGGPVLSLE